MADPFGYRENIYYSESESSFSEASTMTRPSGQAIYRQRKEYIESIITKQQEFQHRVEHLLTSYVDGKDICNAEHCTERLKMMSAQGQVWGQDMFLQVKNQKLLLTDTEAEEELDSYPLDCIQDCICILDRGIYNSILALTVKEVKSHRTNIMLFQCEQIGAELMKTKLEKVIEEWRRERQNQDLVRNNLENMLHRQNLASLNDKRHSFVQDRRAAPQMPSDPATSPYEVTGQGWRPRPWEVSAVPKREAEQGLRQQHWDEFAPEDSRFQTVQQDTDKISEILNHVLGDIEIFVGKLQQTSGTLSDKKKKRKSKKKRDEESLPSELEFQNCFQKVKYSLNLLALLEHTLQQPSAQDLVHPMFAALSTILSHCPWTELAPTVDSPLLIPAAVRLLKHSLNTEEQAMWKSLGVAWSLTRSEYPRGDSIPPYNPVFSDGWVPPTLTQREEASDLNKAHDRNQNTFSNRTSYSPQLMLAALEFHARNSRELTVMKGELLEVLDQQKKWWLARNAAGETGYIPNNILEPMNQKAPKGNSLEKASKSIPDLCPTSSPAEVTAWLKFQGYSNMTVKSLGVLTGSQLLSMSRQDLSTVCPEEGKRVFFKLSAVKLTLE